MNARPDHVVAVDYGKQKLQKPGIIMASKEGKKRRKLYALYHASTQSFIANGGSFLVTGLGPDVTKELLEWYFDAQETEVVNISPPEEGRATVELSNIKG